MSDYISRKAALASMLDFADFYCDETQGAAECVREYISAIPAADVYTREEVGAMIWRALHALKDDYSADEDYDVGWDDAIKAAIAKVEQITGVDGDQLGDKLLDEIEIEVDSL